MVLRFRAMLLVAIFAFCCSATQARAASLLFMWGTLTACVLAGFFPNPFAGSPGVIYSGLSTVSSLDSGALRIDNTGSTPITITNLSVTLNPGTGPIPFALWSAPVTLAPGQKGIYAQTAQYNFDTSDYGFLPVIGIDKSHPLGGCTNPGALTALQQNYCKIDAPVVSFSENGKNLSYIDSANVLNTFGYDFIYGSSDGNESVNWNTIGSPVNRGGNAPEPATFGLLGAAGLLCGMIRRFVRRS